jgi:hypothetical protein
MKLSIDLVAPDIRNWIRNIELHASDNVNKILVGNKADMDESKRAVPTAKGQALADEFGIKFFETVSCPFFWPSVSCAFNMLFNHGLYCWIDQWKKSKCHSHMVLLYGRINSLGEHCICFFTLM